MSFRLIRLLHKYARENLLLANIYIKDPAVTMILRDEKIPVIWFVANVGGILGLCMGCSLVTVFEVLHHIVLIFLRTSVRSVSRIHKTIRCAPGYSGSIRGQRQQQSETPSGLTMAAFMQIGSNMNFLNGSGPIQGMNGSNSPITAAIVNEGDTSDVQNRGHLTPERDFLVGQRSILTPTKAALLLKKKSVMQKVEETSAVHECPNGELPQKNASKLSDENPKDFE